MRNDSISRIVLESLFDNPALDEDLRKISKNFKNRLSYCLVNFFSRVLIFPIWLKAD